MEFEQVADGLYAVRPGEFTAARDQAAAEARQAGDRELAAQVKALRKPTLAAFAVNQLVRRHGAEVGPLLELGRALREAQDRLAGAELRALSAQRHRLVAALTQQARRSAADAGEHLGEAQLREVEQTLRAALADEHAAVALAAGRLSAALEEAGALPPASDGAPPGLRVGGMARTAPARKAGPPRRGKAVQAGRSEGAIHRASARQEAEGRVAEAKAALAGAEDVQQAADREATRLGEEVERLAADTATAAERAERARAALERAEQHLASARAAEKARRDEHATARKRAAEAAVATGRTREDLDRQQARLAELERQGGR
ncbi:hypothetical protein [Streptomyces sp. TLI_171]|uniref:hypothetical protein n=1 Tax=Streptomyces sp. TLI_171 TaxID=1938859 RepID=UPI000C18E4D9|nr:hypothetical protein [Streptomyces sp. TLI_171]RKE23461.1 hypothetical protein BX266_6932 [Streptomyces sp. TLI_171]